jgi:branched-chain amino acid transport system substrate-binding protein
MVSDEHVLAVVGTVDGASSQAMLKVASIIEVPIVNSGTGDSDMTDTGLPWILHNFPDDRAQARVLAQYAVNDLGRKRIGVLGMRTNDAITAVHEFSSEAKGLEATEVLMVDFEKGEKRFSDQLRQLAQARVDVVVLWGEPAEAGLLLQQMGAAGIEQPVLGPSRMGDPALIQIAGAAAEGLVVVSAMNPTSTDLRWQEFQKNYRRRFNMAPDAYAAYGYDGAKLLVAVIRKAGLNRKRIRDALQEYENGAYLGVSGRIRFDENLNNISPLPMARVEGGRFVYWANA